MQILLDAIVSLVALVSPAKVHTIASSLRGKATSSEVPNANALVETPAARAAVVGILNAWAKVQTSGDEVAGMLIGASESRARVEKELSVDLVWTGPTTRFVATRRTEQVLLDLIAGATASLFLVSFVAYNVGSVVSALNDAASRGVRLRVLLEASAGQGGTLDFDAASILRAKIPAAEIFTWGLRSASFAEGKVHAKVAVVDSRRAFITSANLTSHALEKNMEAGVLIHGGQVPKRIGDHLQALIDVGIIQLV